MTRPASSRRRPPHPVRDQILAVPPGAEDRAERIAQLRAEAARSAVQTARTLDENGVVQITTAAGQTVLIERIELSPEDAEMAYVDVYLAGQPEGGDVHFRVINPPTLVEDRTGSIELAGVGRFREDPLLALAEAIAANGGAAR